MVVDFPKATQQCDTKDNTTIVTTVDHITKEVVVDLSKATRQCTQQPDEKASIVSEVPPTHVIPFVGGEAMEKTSDAIFGYGGMMLNSSLLLKL